MFFKEKVFLPMRDLLEDICARISFVQDDMKLLIITNLFPNSAEPNRSPFNFQQIKELAKLCGLRVVAPVPYFQYSWQQVPYCEDISGIKTYHPRYLVIPKILRSLYGIFFYLGIKGTVREIYKDFAFDKILATWAYPDAYATALIAKKLKKPLAVKVHGSDINITTQYFWRRKMIQRALRYAEKVIAVTGPLKQKIIQLGVPAEKIVVIPNGIDTELFKPMHQAECRKKLGLPLDKKIILFAGNFEKVKGVDILVDGFSQVVRSCLEAMLVLVGSGPLEGLLRNKVKEFGIGCSVFFAGRNTHVSIPYYMNACDVFVLPSRNEGCPNVLLEALACGVSIVASRTGGIPEIIKNDRMGYLVEPNNSAVLAEAIKAVLNTSTDKAFLQNHVTGMSWRVNAEQLYRTISSSIL